MPLAEVLAAIPVGPELDVACERSLIKDRPVLDEASCQWSTDHTAAVVLLTATAQRWDAVVSITLQRSGEWFCEIDAKKDPAFITEGSGSTLAEAITRALALEAEE